MANKIQIVLPGVPPSLNAFNGRRNVWEYREAKTYWTNLVVLLSRKKRPQRPYDMASVTIRYTFRDRRRRDPDNYSGKMLLDGLTRAGIIVDDSFSHIRLAQEASPEPGNEQTVITVEEIKEEAKNG